MTEESHDGLSYLQRFSGGWVNLRDIFLVDYLLVISNPHPLPMTFRWSAGEICRSRRLPSPHELASHLSLVVVPRQATRFREITHHILDFALTSEDQPIPSGN